LFPSALIGLEREIRRKSAGLRTYTLVGLASALIILISKYGFTHLLADDWVVLDPSRVARADCLWDRSSAAADLVCGVTTAARQLEDKRKELR
jgi:hypothetical protein